MIRSCIIFLLFLFVSSTVVSQEIAVGRKNKKFRKKLVRELPKYKQVFKNADTYRLEIIYGKIDFDNSGKRKVTYFQTGSPNTYYYPASLVKLPIAVKFLEWVSDQNVTDLHQLTIQPVSDSACGQPTTNPQRHYYVRIKNPVPSKDFALLYRDYCSHQVFDSLWNVNSTLTAGTIIRLTDSVTHINCHEAMYEMLVQSDNQFYNLFYEAAGSLRTSADPYMFIPRPFVACTGTYESNGVDMYLLNEKWKTLPGGAAKKSCSCKMKNETVGIAKISASGDTIKTGRDFSTHNHVPLLAITQMLQEITCPAPMPRFISPYLRTQLLHQLQTFLRSRPDEKSLCTYKEYLDAKPTRTNFLFNLRDTTGNGTGRYYNIIGQAYGFTSDVLYYCDPVEGTEFFLSARIYTNADEVLNDDRYEYGQIAFPLMRDLFTYIYSIEKGRMKSTSNGLLYYPEQR